MAQIRNHLRKSRTVAVEKKGQHLGKISAGANGALAAQAVERPDHGIAPNKASYRRHVPIRQTDGAFHNRSRSKCASASAQIFSIASRTIASSQGSEEA